MKRVSLLYKSNVEYGDYAANYVEGCSHGCGFCYALLAAKRTGRVKTYEEWIMPKIVPNTLEILTKEIPKLKDKVKFVQLCFMTDPFMHKHDDVKDISLKVIRMLNENEIKCVVLTKGILPVELANTNLYSDQNEYGITLVSLDPEFKRKFEPFSAPYDERIKSLELLHSKGFKTWVSMEPYPTPNLVKQNLLDVIASVCFVDKLIFGKMNYNKECTAFKGRDRFYEECMKEIESLATQVEFKYYFKKGTANGRQGNVENIF